jgi:hypothetical protein
MRSETLLVTVSSVPQIGLIVSLPLRLLILNRARPSAGILRVIRDWHPLMLFPFL